MVQTSPKPSCTVREDTTAVLAPTSPSPLTTFIQSTWLQSKLGAWKLLSGDMFQVSHLPNQQHSRRATDKARSADPPSTGLDEVNSNHLCPILGSSISAQNPELCTRCSFHCFGSQPPNHLFLLLPIHSPEHIFTCIISTNNQPRNSGLALWSLFHLRSAWQHPFVCLDPTISSSQECKTNRCCCPSLSWSQFRAFQGNTPRHSSTMKGCTCPRPLRTLRNSKNSSDHVHVRSLPCPCIPSAATRMK